MRQYPLLSFFWLVGCTAQILASRYARHNVDSSTMPLKLLPASSNLAQCLAYCKVKAGCNAAEYDRNTGTCISVRRGSISWSVPSKKVYIDMENPSKIGEIKETKQVAILIVMIFFNYLLLYFKTFSVQFLVCWPRHIFHVTFLFSPLFVFQSCAPMVTITFLVPIPASEWSKLWRLFKMPLLHVKVTEQP